MNTFTGANQSFPNMGIHFLIGEIMTFRQQLTVRPELKSVAGWNDALNAYIVEELERLRDTLENVTYNPDDVTKEELESQSADTTRSLVDDYNVMALSSDNVVQPALIPRNVEFNLTGADADIPQLDPKVHKNHTLRSLITALDQLFVVLTRLESRYQPQTITRYESSMVNSKLNEMYTLTQRKGGAVNRPDVPTGTLPTDEPGTFKG